MNSPALILLRSFARRLGVTKLLNRWAASSNYEQNFKRAMLDTVRSGDIVWDVGANVGYYTKLFAEAVADRGLVIAFEPDPSCFQKLTRNTQQLDGRVRLYNAGLGREDGFLNFRVGDDPDLTTGRFVEETVAITDDIITLPVFTADNLLLNDDLSVPSVIKIDVEGYEEEVIEGMKRILDADECKNIFIEIHFSILESRKKTFAPTRISQLLKMSGFRIRWLDPSHLHGFKQ